MRVLVFGASITQGYWDTKGGWVQRLRAFYDEQQVKDLTKDGLSIFNLGISADTTADILRRFDSETQARLRKNTAIVLSCGINDSSIMNGQEKSTPERFEAELNELFSKAKQYSSKIMFIGLGPCGEDLTNPVPPWWHKDLIYTNERILAFDKTARKVCAEYDVLYVPIYDAMKKEIDDDKKLLIDGLHPNDVGHQLIFELVRPELDKLLTRQG
ncbi:MAG TPA: GDSL-type esterase/lipase family protein [Candidatus Saccharimonadales bacterium]|nr:GDSL-type esterase/lipase family protein [Candidatus Saccharimonadales bacterium]